MEVFMNALLFILGQKDHEILAAMHLTPLSTQGYERLRSVTYAFTSVNKADLCMLWVMIVSLKLT